MRVDEVGVARRSARSSRVGGEKRAARAPSRHGAARRFWAIPPPYAIPKCRNEAGETTSTSTPARPHPLDCVANEVPCHVARVARVRRRQDDDLHGSRGAKTTGIASESATNA